MYRPASFDVSDLGELHDLLDAHGPAHLVTAGHGGIDASVVPMVLDRDRGELGTLRGHLARPNPQWRDAEPGARALAIVAGPDAYVSPSWYPTKRETGRVVPTWNYVVVHAHGELTVRDDVAWVERVVRDLTDRHEARRPEPWSVDDAPRDFVDAQLRAVVGVELRITRLEGKCKLSQNRPADRAGVVAGLRADGGAGVAVADLMTER